RDRPRFLCEFAACPRSSQCADDRRAGRSAETSLRTRQARRRDRFSRRGFDHPMGSRHGSGASLPGGRRVMNARFRDALPEVRGSYVENAPLKDFVWFRVGGPAEILFRPADEDDLRAFLAGKPANLPVSTIGVGSNLLVRDGGINGAVIRLPASFGKISVEKNCVRAGAAALDATV